MPDYSKSVIYKLYDNTNEDTYYGSTCNKLRFRIKDHKNKALSKTVIHNCKSKSIILNDDYTYSVVEEYPCETKLQLHTRERWWIENNKCVNKNIPSRTQKEWFDSNSEENKQKCKIYYENNQEEMKIYFNKYNKDNKETNKTKRSVKILCECGIEVSKGGITRHRKSPKHIKLMSCLPCPSPPQSSPH